MNRYLKMKEQIREKAIGWQLTFADRNYTYCELSYFQEHFTRLAKKYGLVKEFKENGII